MTHLIVNRHWLLRIVLAILVVGVALSFTLWLLADEKSQLDVQQVREAAAQHQLLQKHQQLQAANEQLRQQVTMLQADGELDRRAAASLHEEVMRLQDQVYELNRELGFYQNVLAATGEGAGMQLQGLLIEPARGNRRYRFKLVLTHVANDDKVMQGRAHIAVEGESGGESRTLALADILHGSPVALDYEFKHFKRFEGHFELPAGFMPHLVVVTLVPNGSAEASVERAFDWLDVIL